MNEIENYYNFKYDEWNRLERHKIEFDITKRFLDEFIKGENLNIIDIGGGPGRYSIYLAQKGHRVTLVDLSENHIEIAKEKSVENNVELENCIHANALDLGSIQGPFDYVLLMGPLYHLLHLADRKKVMEEALRLLKPNGMIIASFISCYAPIQDVLLHMDKVTSVDHFLNYLNEGENKDTATFTTAYFIKPDEAKNFMQNFGLEELAFAGIENILASKELDINALDEEQYNKWLEIAYQLSTDPYLYGSSMHYLYIGRKE